MIYFLVVKRALLKLLYYSIMWHRYYFDKISKLTHAVLHPPHCQTERNQARFQ
jgi:hypothetical protein